jgi:hypothetical protein
MLVRNRIDFLAVSNYRRASILPYSVNQEGVARRSARGASDYLSAQQGEGSSVDRSRYALKRRIQQE